MDHPLSDGQDESRGKMKVLVVGGTSGTGLQIVEDLERNGNEVFAPTIEEFDVRVQGRNQYLYKLGNIDGIVYCAGINEPESIGEIDSNSMWHTFDVNVHGFIMLLDRMVRLHGKEKLLSVVAIVSEAAHTPMRNSISYVTSKAALAMAVRCAARELAPYWRVNGVNPAVIADTPMSDKMDELIPKLRGWTPEQALAYETSMIPMGRRVTKAEVSELVCNILAGPDFMTGSLVNITGGKS